MFSSPEMKRDKIENMVKPSCATVVVQFNLHLHLTFSPWEGIQFFKFSDCNSVQRK